MSRLSRIDDPISIMEELLNPYKGNMEMTPRVWEVGTKDNPTIVGTLGIYPKRSGGRLGGKPSVGMLITLVRRLTCPLL